MSTIEAPAMPTTATGLSALAELIDTKNLPDPEGVFFWASLDPEHPVKARFHFTDPDEFAAFMAAVPKDGLARKEQDGHGGWVCEFKVRGYPVSIRASLSGVCELIDTGEVEEYEDVEVVRPAETRTVVKTRPKLERRCPESLLALGTEVPA